MDRGRQVGIGRTVVSAGHHAGRRVLCEQLWSSAALRHVSQTGMCEVAALAASRTSDTDVRGVISDEISGTRRLPARTYRRIAVRLADSDDGF